MSRDIRTIFKSGKALRLLPGEVLFRTSDPVSRMYLIERGEVALRRFTPAGSVLVLQCAAPGQILAEASAYSILYHCEAVGQSEAKLRHIRVEAFRRAMTMDSELAEAWAAQLAHAVQSARLRSEIRTLRTVAERLDAWLGDGRQLPEKGEWQHLASVLGVSREALYRELAKRRYKARV